MGAGYGTFKSGIGISGMGTFHPELMMKALIPVVMAGIISVYGLVISVLIAGSLTPTGYSLFSGFVHLGAGLCVGLTGLAAGYAIGIVGDVCVRGYAYQPRLFVAMVLVLIFAEVLGLYGLIVGLILNTKAMSSYSAYRSHHNSSSESNNQSRSPTPTSPTYSEQTRVISIDYSTDPKTNYYYNNNNNYDNNNYSGNGIHDIALASPTSTIYNNLQMPSSTSSREGSTTKGFSNTSISEPTRWKRLRLQVMKMATVERLQLLWALLALFGTMSWLSLMPAYAFRNKLEIPFGPHSYAFFLVATVATSLSAIWQSLCPFLVRQSQRALLPRVINHPATQTATILISVILTILNFFSWIVLASDKEFGAKKSCSIGPLAKEAGYTAQCRGVNVAIIFDVVVFLLWIPISLVIVCGTIERGLWWWGDDDGWAQNEAIVGGSNMMSEEEFDMKIGLGGVKQVKRRQTVHPDNLQHQDMVMIQQPKPAFVTPIASQFQSSTSLALEEGDDDDFTNFTPSSYRRHHHQRQQQQQQQQRRTESGRLSRRPSNLSLSSRLSGFFGAGWGAGSMPPPEEPMPEMPAQYRGENSANVSRNNLSVNSQNVNGEHKVKSSRKKEESKREVEEQQPEAPAPLHGAEYTSQWHSRRYDDWS
ncbi:v-type proton ATPase 16 kDa proteolipid subunit 2 [Haplosporangium sp. Z 27]|nr:v-type proton ATPase 16 kDa proteolipid subunit 2 [Haplosporangium sp. Z 27]